ncbi:MAG: hypothetical protein IPL61_40175 [Myxococcales bacterium]|nr:hypothetical protein [Myxococcales bacterium]
MRRLAWATIAALGLTATSTAEPRLGAIVRVVQPDATPTLGPRDALVTVDLYFVPGADPSHSAYRAVRALADRHPGRVRARFYPRRVGPHQVTPAMALAAHRRGQFFAFLDALAARPTTPSAATTLALAVDLGLDRDVAITAARDPELDQILTTNDHRAFRSMARQAVEVAVNGQPLSLGQLRMNAGSMSVAQLEQAYQAALVEARLAAAQGLTGSALVRWGRLRGGCDDAGAADDDAPAPPPGFEPPTYAWSLGRVLDRGTDCAAPMPRPARLDDPPMTGDDDAPRPRLLDAPLPIAGAPAVGPADAAVPIVVACNPRGENCRGQLSALRGLVDVYEGAVRLVWVPWIDLGFEASAADLELAAAALCAAELGDGWPFTSDPAGIHRAPPAVPELAREAKVDPQAVAACVAPTTERVRIMVAAAERAGVGWGPTVVIGGRAYVGGFIDGQAAAMVVEHALSPGLLEQLNR